MKSKKKQNREVKLISRLNLNFKKYFDININK